LTRSSTLMEAGLSRPQRPPRKIPALRAE